MFIGILSLILLKISCLVLFVSGGELNLLQSFFYILIYIYDLNMKMLSNHSFLERICRLLTSIGIWLGHCMTG